MNIIIVGAGKVGYALAKNLSDENDNITIIDNKISALERINNNLDVMCVKGNCTSLKVLNEAGIEDADLLISVTNSDELNMLCSLAGKKLGAKHTIARVRNPGYDEDITLLTEAVGINLVINPEKAAAMEIAKLIKYPSVSSVDVFAEGKVNMVSFNITDDTGLVDKKVSDLNNIRGNILFCGVEKDDEVIIPKGDYVFSRDDKAYVIGEHKDIQEMFKRMGRYKKKIRSAMIIGGGRIAYYLSKIATESGVHCKLIESDLDKCEELTELLPSSVIINGDGLDQDLLLSESLNEVDSFITLTGRDEDNLIAALFAAQNGVKNIITKITRDNYNDVAKTIGINSIISPKRVTANKIIKYVRTIKSRRKCLIENIYKICNEKAEAIEFMVNHDFKFQNIKIKDLNFKVDCLIATIVRNKKTIIPSGDDFLQDGDRVVVVVTKNSNLLSLSEILNVGGKVHEL
ncbi:MAG: Trk system potassium transporter TrkA [Clostridium butyricum]|nr:Trk system potassium transporter TrkA [Clostridium butyricum]